MSQYSKPVAVLKTFQAAIVAKVSVEEIEKRWAEIAAKKTPSVQSLKAKIDWLDGIISGKPLNEQSNQNPKDE